MTEDDLRAIESRASIADVNDINGHADESLNEDVPALIAEVRLLREKLANAETYIDGLRAGTAAF